MNKLTTGVVCLALTCFSSVAASGEIADLFDLASEKGRAEGVVTGLFERNIRDYTQAVGDIYATVDSAGLQAGCRMFSLRLKMNVKTQQGGVVPYEQPLMVPVCPNGLPPAGFLPPDMHQRLVENLERTTDTD